jgi:nitrogen-specific signal transduction histidine kinase
VVLFSDITNHKRLEEQFRQIQKLEAIGELAGGIAHDFNNILTVIQGASDFLLANIEKGHPAFENVKKINNAAERAESLTRQLLAFSRRQMLQPRVLDVNKFIREMESTFQKILGDNTEIEIVLQSEQGNIKADPSQIEQVITNLIINARDAMPGGGHLTLETKDVILDEKYIKKRPMVKPGSYVMFAISDTGIGMDKDHAAHIFEPFFTTKEKGKGTGMGLATVYGIVKQSEGYIWVYSEPDKGTTFKIYLPRIEEYTDLEEQPVISDQSLKGSETILVVDDEEEVRNLVSEMLRFQGYKVLEAPNASNALVIFEKYCTSVDLILTDVVMPQMSGPELMEKLHASYPDVKVLFMSGYTDNVVVKHGLLSEEGNFIQKPFSSALLIQKVRTILDQ